MSIHLTPEQAERNATRRRIYPPGGLMTVVRQAEMVTRYVSGPDEEGDIFVPGVGALTNIYGGTIDDDGWAISRYERRRHA